MYNVLVLDKHCNSVVKLSDLTTLRYCGRPNDTLFYANGQNGVLSLINDDVVELNLPKVQFIVSSIFASDLTLNAPNLIETYQGLSFHNILVNFKGDLLNLIDGRSLFTYNSNLTNFIGVLPSLVNGSQMFYKCKLNPQSVANILFSLRDINELKAEKEVLDSKYSTLVSNMVNAGNTQEAAEEQASATIYPEIGWSKDGNYSYIANGLWSTGSAENNYQPIYFKNKISYESVGKLDIGINVSSKAVDGKDTATQLLQFSNEVGFDTWADLKQAFVDKGWTVTFQYGGTYTNIPSTYDMRGGEREIPLPVYTKLIEVQNKELAEYCNEDGSKFYNINWGHDVTHPEEFQQFDSLEDAAVSYGVFRKEFLEEA